MAEVKLAVPNISCMHCVRTITQGLSELQGVKNVKGDANSKSVVVDFDAPADEVKIREKLKDIGYPARQ
jgi:copper chaperone